MIRPDVSSISPYSILALLYKVILLFFWSIIIESDASYLTLSKRTDFLSWSLNDRESRITSSVWEFKELNPEKIKIEYLDEKNSKKTSTFKGFESRIIQHELDHLNGITFDNYVSPIEFKKAQEKAQAEWVN